MGPLSSNHSKKLEQGPLVGPQRPPSFQGKDIFKIFWWPSACDLLIRIDMYIESYDLIELWWPTINRHGPLDSLKGPQVLVSTSSVDTRQTQARPSKCPKFYTNRILGDKNLRQKVRKFCQNLNRNKKPVFYKIYFNSPVFNIGLYKTVYYRHSKCPKLYTTWFWVKKLTPKRA